MVKQCQRFECLKPAFEGKRFCQKHYTETLLRRGVSNRAKVTKPFAPRMKPGVGLFWLEEKLRDCTARSPLDDGAKGNCIMWPFGNHPGTAVIRFDGKDMKPSRVMCILAYGRPRDDKTWALHSCGNGHLGCVNPRHLYWGDASDNAKDAHRHRKEGKPGIKVRAKGEPRQRWQTREILVSQHNAKQAQRAL